MNPKNKLAAAGLTAGLLAGGAAGLILQSSGSASAGAKVTAVTDPSTPTGGSTGTGSSTPAPVDADRPDPTERINEVLKPLVDDGTLTQDQADKVAKAFAEHMPKMGGRGGPGSHRGGEHGGFKNLEVAATAIGITADELRTEVMAGSTIAQIAEAHGKTAQNVIDALVADAKTRLDAKVADGTITQADADARLTEQTGRITEAVNSTRPMFNRGGRDGFPGKPGDLPAPTTAAPSTAAPSTDAPSTDAPATSQG